MLKRVAVSIIFSLFASACASVHLIHDFPDAETAYIVGSVEVYDIDDSGRDEPVNMDDVSIHMGSNFAGAKIPMNNASGMADYKQPGAPARRRYFLAKATPGEHEMGWVYLASEPETVTNFLGEKVQQSTGGIFFPLKGKFVVRAGVVNFVGNFIIKMNYENRKFKASRTKDINIESLRAYWKLKNRRLKIDGLPIVGP